MTFRKHYDTIRSTIQSPDMLASTLYAKHLVCKDVRDEAQLDTSTVMKKCQVLLNAVEQKIKSNPCHFHHFLDILKEEPLSEDLYSLLWQTYGKGRVSGLLDWIVELEVELILVNLFISHKGQLNE